MTLRCALLLILLINSFSCCAAAAIMLPQSLIIETIETSCDQPSPDPRVSPVLNYACSYPYQDQEGDEHSMNYSVQLIPLIEEDFNQDGIKDIALEVRSAGPLGGSVYTNSAIYYELLDRDEQMIYQHEILLYAPFSEDIIDYEVKGNKIYYSAVPNYRSNYEAYDDNGNLIESPTAFEVAWFGGKPMSVYHQDDCLLSEADSGQIFKKNSFESIDSYRYKHIRLEEAQINNFRVIAKSDACDVRTLSLYIEPIADKSLPILAEVLQSLAPVVYQSKPLEMLMSLERKSEIVFDEVMRLDSHWSGQIRIDRASANTNMTIDLYQIK